MIENDDCGARLRLFHTTRQLKQAAIAEQPVSQAYVSRPGSGAVIPESDVPGQIEALLAATASRPVFKAWCETVVRGNGHGSLIGLGVEHAGARFTFA